MPPTDSINIHIQRTPHVTATDFEFLDSMVRDPRFHIYAPELEGADSTLLEGLRKIARGDSKVYRDIMSRTDKNSTWSKTFGALFMLRKQIESFDVTAEQHEANEVFRGFGQAVLDLSRITSRQVIDNMPAQLQRLPTFITARDTLIAQNVVEQLPLIISANSKLKSLGKVGLLMTIGDNHQLVDKILESEGFDVTKNDIPVMGAQEKAGLMQLEGKMPTDTEVLEAAAYNIIRGFVTHDSTYELRRQLNAFVPGTDESDIATILSEIQKHGIEGIKNLVTGKLEEVDIDTDLGFIMPGSKALAIRPKETVERRNGIMGIRIGMF